MPNTMTRVEQPSTRVGPAVQTREVPRERIAARAYEIFLARGSSAGDSVSDWLQAEREIKSRVNPATVEAKPASQGEARAVARGEVLLRSGS
ncbi:hypothetical protein PHYC_01949 [Phycisphaerales bacterium]|nr:hypothetical protein PHYC_01949 [Phycisphaerales bacterium]